MGAQKGAMGAHRSQWPWGATGQMYPLNYETIAPAQWRTRKLAPKSDAANKSAGAPLLCPRLGSCELRQTNCKLLARRQSQC